MKKLYFILILAFLFKEANSQNTEVLGSVKLHSYNKVYKKVTAIGCPVTYTPLKEGQSQTTVTYETKYKNNKTDITITETYKPSTTVDLFADKEIIKYINMGDDNWANLYFEDKDKSVLHINFWLSSNKFLAAGTTVESFEPVYQCDGTPNFVSRGKKILTQGEYNTYYQVDAHSNEVNSDWFKNSEHFKVYNISNPSILEYYLVNKYDISNKYMLKLNNRESLSYKSSSLDLGALTIPFKYRFKYKKGDFNIKSDVSASFNIGAYAGYKLTKYHLINRADSYVHKSMFSLRVGPFINISAAALDSTNTTTGKTPFKKDEKQNIAVLSTGIGLMGDIRGLQVGIYGGWDFGMGPEGSNWNYHRKFWLGFGIGYKITDLFAKKD